MNRPSTSSKPRRPRHRLIEHYTPDGTLGRLLFVVGMAPVFTFFVWMLGVGITVPGILSLLLALAATIASVGTVLLALVVLWPVYLSLIGNIEAPENYSNGGSTASTDLDDGDRDDSISVLKRQYAAGKISQEEFEHRLDTLLDVEANTLRSSNSASEERPAAREFDHN